MNSHDIDWRHHETICRVLEAIQAVESDVLRAAVAVEDVYCELMLGAQMGLSLTQILAEHERVIAHLAKP